MKIHRLRSYRQWLEYSKEIESERRRWREIEQGHVERLAGHSKWRASASIGITGYSYAAESPVEFLLDCRYGTIDDPNWRERLVCPITGLNNRIRASVQIMDIECEPYLGSAIYATEQVTPLFAFLNRRYPKLIGSEYLGAEVALGTANSDGVRNEDLTALSFEAESFDICLSFDCLEHIPDFANAFSELFRVLKNRGTLLWSAPFAPNSATNLIRAKLRDDGSIDHVLPPEYHGNPVSSKGSLCFTVFGWEALDLIRRVGFSDAYAVVYWSEAFGYLGGDQMLFVAVK